MTIYYDVDFFSTFASVFWEEYVIITLSIHSPKLLISQQIKQAEFCPHSLRPLTACSWLCCSVWQSGPQNMIGGCCQSTSRWEIILYISGRSNVIPKNPEKQSEIRRGKSETKKGIREIQQPRKENLMHHQWLESKGVMFRRGNGDWSPITSMN